MIYVIKENRTYDQILGDLKVGDTKIGDGDPSITMYGADITPNEHKLALQFGVLDNFYDSGEVSGDGHLWSTAAITSDYNEKTWQIAYRGKERTYDFQGQNADEYPLEHNLPDIDDPATGYLWDNLARNHVSFRDYGEFVNAEWCNEKRKAARWDAPRSRPRPPAARADPPKMCTIRGEAPAHGAPPASICSIAGSSASIPMTRCGIPTTSPRIAASWRRRRIADAFLNEVLTLAERAVFSRRALHRRRDAAWRRGRATGDVAPEGWSCSLAAAPFGHP